MILIVVKFPVRPERAAEWPTLAGEYARAVNQEEGNLFFEWSKSLEEPDTFVCVEGFRDAAAGSAHVGTQAFKDFVEKAPDLVAAQRQVIYVDATDVAGWGPMGEIQPRSASHRPGGAEWFRAGATQRLHPAGGRPLAPVSHRVE